MHKKYEIKGMHCRSCEILLEKGISEIEGVRKVNVNHRRGIAEVDFSGPVANDAAVAQAVREAGYSLGKETKLAWFSRDGETYFELLLGASALLLLFMVGKLAGVFDGLGASFGSAPTFPIVFVIGLTAGISTCMAVVGGLVAGFSGAYAETHQFATRWQRFKPNLFFNAGRLVSYAALGGAIGALGSAMKLSTGFTGFLVAAAGLVMLYLGLKLTGLSPKLANLNLTLPKKLGRALGMKNQNGDYSHREAFVGGALTFFLPCGFTQAMQLYAITTGSFASGAVIMFLFALGTMPGLLGIGALTSVLSGMVGRVFFRFVGLVVVILGFVNLASGYNLSGLTVSFPSFASGGTPQAGTLPTVVDGEQVVPMAQLANGYQPNRLTVKKGIPVKWEIDSKSSYTCAASIRMPAYGIAQSLALGANVIRFMPNAAGMVKFTCGMGMYSGTFIVVN